MINRIIWIDLIKVFAMFAVIFLHSAAPILYEINKIDFSYWMTGNIYDSMVRMAVPLFFMVSGVLLLNQKDVPLPIFFKKRFFKVVIPLIVWSFIYIIAIKFGANKDINIFKHLIASLNRPEYFHLWFLYTIIGIYLILPIIKVFIKNASNNIQIYFIILWIVSVSVIPFINYFMGYQIKSYMPMMSGYIGYLILGYQLAKVKITKNIFYISMLIILTSTLITVFGTYYLSEKAGEYISLFYGNFSVSTLLQAISYFIFLKYIGENTLTKYRTISNGVSIISITSLGIYLIHPLFINILSKIGLSVHTTNPLIIVPIVAILTFILSFITIFILHKLPFGKTIAP